MARGASSRSGPAPDPNALRRDRDGKEFVELPASGRAGPAPEWPLSSPTGRELELWEREWSRPQAIMWERNGQELEVAVFVRSVSVAEQHQAPTNARTLVRQQMEALGVSVPGLLRNGWRIVSDAPPDPRRPEKRDGSSVRDRLSVVDGGA